MDKFSSASNLLSTVSSPAFKRAYERDCTIWDERDELDKLITSIEMIHASLLVAEKKQLSSTAVKNWKRRVKDVFNVAEDWFDEVTTDDMLNHLKGGNKILSKVRKLNPFVCRDSIANKVKAIRKSLLEISNDMAQIQFERYLVEAPVRDGRKRERPVVIPNWAFGMEEDKKAILKFLFNDVPLVIAIVGIGGIGKSMLAELVYNDEEVEKKFEKMWFCCLFDTSDEQEVLGKIFQTICCRNYRGLTVGQLQTDIREAMKGVKNFLLVLDDVEDEDCGRWQHRMSLLSNCSEGSKIIITTRSLSIATAVGASKVHTLYRLLSDDDSWNLFKRAVITPKKYENDSRRIELGREFVKKCGNFPPAIMGVINFVYIRHTIHEWESFRNYGFSEVLEPIREYYGTSIFF